jgi:hypothetical protein|tara:strand:+ start:281 stop:523 length:243 start_codon:yes stop_codon:yes gene_type:complete
MATIYAVINLSDTNAVLFSQVNQSSAQTMTRNIANTQGILSYSVEPSFITNGSLVPVSILNHTEVLALLQTPEWRGPDPE